MIKCEVCGASPSDGRTTLLRQNPKGQPGVWRCEGCNRLKVDDAVLGVVAELQYLRDGKKHDA